MPSHLSERERVRKKARDPLMRELEAALSGLRGAVRAYRAPSREEYERAGQPKRLRGIGNDVRRISTDDGGAIDARLRRRLAACLRAIAGKMLGSYRR